MQTEGEPINLLALLLFLLFLYVMTLLLALGKAILHWFSPYWTLTTTALLLGAASILFLLFLPVPVHYRGTMFWAAKNMLLGGALAVVVGYIVGAFRSYLRRHS